jgi:hypothetical protein
LKRDKIGVTQGAEKLHYGPSGPMRKLVTIDGLLPLDRKTLVQLLLIKRTKLEALSFWARRFLPNFPILFSVPRQREFCLPHLNFTILPALPPSASHIIFKQDTQYPYPKFLHFSSYWLRSQ